MATTDALKPPEALKAASAAFLAALEAATRAKLMNRKTQAQILGVQINTLSGWYCNPEANPCLERGKGGELGANMRLTEMERQCEVPAGTLVAPYRDVVDARRGITATARHRKQIERRVPAPVVLDLRTDADDPYLGVSRVHRSFPSAMFARHIERASRVRILNIWYPNLNPLRPSIIAALANGCAMEFTLLNPFCSAALTRASTLGYPPGSEPVHSVAGEIEESLTDLRRIADESGRADLITTYFYPEIPAMAFYQADEYTLASPYLHGRLAVDGPQLEIGCQGSFMDTFVSDELARVRSGSLGPAPLPTWRSWLNRQL